MRGKSIKRIIFERTTLGVLLFLVLYFLFNVTGRASQGGQDVLSAYQNNVYADGFFGNGTDSNTAAGIDTASVAGNDTASAAGIDTASAAGIDTASAADSADSTTGNARDSADSIANSESTASAASTPSPYPNVTNDLIGVNDIIFQPETSAVNALHSIQTEEITFHDTDKLYDFDYLRSQFYLVEADTGLLPGDVDTDYFLSADFTIDTRVDGPKVLIFHTHSNEKYADSDPDDPMDSVLGVGKALADLLTYEYGVETLHHQGRYDIVNGKSQIAGAYERMEPVITEILRDNPSIQMVIDIHRDGLGEGIPPMVTDITGQRAARIMFLNGLSRLRSGGVLVPVTGLENPYITDNMALSMQLQLTANHLYPGLTRKLYLKAYRYSLHMLPRSILVEVGAQNNTMQEALNAMPPLADLIARVILP